MITGLLGSGAVVYGADVALGGLFQLSLGTKTALHCPAWHAHRPPQSIVKGAQLSSHALPAHAGPLSIGTQAFGWQHSVGTQSASTAHSAGAWGAFASPLISGVDASGGVGVVSTSAGEEMHADGASASAIEPRQLFAVDRGERRSLRIISLVVLIEVRPIYRL